MIRYSIWRPPEKCPQNTYLQKSQSTKCKYLFLQMHGSSSTAHIWTDLCLVSGHFSDIPDTHGKCLAQYLLWKRNWINLSYMNWTWSLRKLGLWPELENIRTWTRAWQFIILTDLISGLPTTTALTWPWLSRTGAPAPERPKFKTSWKQETLVWETKWRILDYVMI